MCKFIGKSDEQILCKLSRIEILRLYSIVHVAMETTKTSHFTSQSKSFISIFFTCQVSACELQPFSCHDLANDIHSQTAKTMFSQLKRRELGLELERSDRARVLTEMVEFIALAFPFPSKLKIWPSYVVVLQGTVDCRQGTGKDGTS